MKKILIHFDEIILEHFDNFDADETTLNNFLQ